ncbi:MAG: molybdenum cofactor guanylyltransferase [Terriglobales bacterium]|jgi:molybdopterin-guanine dinucleotide biosynthesis protein A
MPSTADVTAFILAGGKSSRMGSDKAFLEFRGQKLLARALGLATAVVGQVRIVGPHTRFAEYAGVVEDVFLDRGPLGAIHAALCASSSELNLMLAVDLPFLQAEFLRFLIDRARASSALVTLPLGGGQLQPTCAVYRLGFRRLAEEALRAQRNRIDALFHAANTLVIDESEMNALSFPAAMFHNLNTPEEFERARKTTVTRTDTGMR